MSPVNVLMLHCSYLTTHNTASKSSLIWYSPSRLGPSMPASWPKEAFMWRCLKLGKVDINLSLLSHCLFLSIHWLWMHWDNSISQPWLQRFPFLLRYPESQSSERPEHQLGFVTQGSASTEAYRHGGEGKRAQTYCSEGSKLLETSYLNGSKWVHDFWAGWSKYTHAWGWPWPCVPSTQGTNIKWLKQWQIMYMWLHIPKPYYFN